jgi:hypothetical protein
MKHALSYLLIGFFCLTSAVNADSLPQPTGEVILYVHGDIEITNGAGPAAMFDRAMLEQLGMQTIITTTPITEGVITFEGPLMRDLLDAVIANGENVTLTALDDYASTFPISDVRDHDFILAIRDDQGLISPDQLGPIWVVGPMDGDPAIGEEDMHGRWIWQLSVIEVN